MKFIKLNTERTICYPVGYYMTNNLEVIKLMVQECNKIISKQKDITHINLWCRGSSGAILAGILSSLLMNAHTLIKIDIIHIKKEREKSHFFNRNIQVRGFNSFHIIVDDFVETGSTIAQIYDILNKHKKQKEKVCLCISRNLDISIFEKFSTALNLDIKFDYIIANELYK